MIFEVVQGVIVAIVVLTALLMALKKYVPATKRLQGALADKLLTPGRSAPARWLGKKLHGQLSAAGGCGSDDGCGSCKGCAPSKPTHSGPEIFRTKV